MKEKFCTKCGRLLPIDEYYIKDRKKGYRFSWCKECQREIKRRRYAAKRYGIIINPKNKAL